MNKDFKKQTIYQIYPRSFQDTNNDGFGDLEGVIKRLPLLSKLGIDMIWLSPFYKSHQHDNGYDVDDYMSIDEKFGDFEVFDRLIKESKKLNIEIMLDMVFNHTSTYHEWFQKALQGDEKYQNYYIFKKSDSIPTNWDSKFGGSAWKYVENLDKYYLHLFHEKQADLNWENQEVRDELVKVLKFWLEKGVKGFRFDVINLISKPEIFEDDFEGDGRRFYTDGPKVIDYLHEIFKKAEMDDTVTVGELSSTSIENSIKYTNPNNGGLSMAFNFHHLKVDYKNGDKWSLGSQNWEDFFILLDNWQIRVQEGGGWSAWFLNNHDQPRAISRFKESEGFDFELASALATLTHTMRGTPYVYQGEEIGMKNNGFDSIEKYRDYESINYYQILLDRNYTKDQALKTLAERSRDNGRAPVRWDDSIYGDFSEVTPWMDATSDTKVNYKDALEDENSLFYHYQKLIKLRKDEDLISHGKYEKLIIDNRVYGFKRILEDNELIVLLNFSTQSYQLPKEVLNQFDSKNVLNDNLNNFDFKNLNPYQAVILK